MTDSTAAAARDARRLGRFFAAYFALVGMLATYLPLYFESIGLSAFQIGLLIATGQGMRVVGPTLWGWIADHTQQRTAVLRLTALGVGLSFSMLFVGPTFAIVFAAMLLMNFFMTAQMPIGEALASARMRGSADAPRRYGRLRIWGSGSFVLVVLTLGPLFDRFGMGLALWAGVALAAVLVVVAFRVTDPGLQTQVQEPVSVRRRLDEPRVRWFLLSSALMVFAHGALYTYFSLYLAQLGYSKAAIGAFWVLGVLSEMAFFYTQGGWFARFGLRALITASFVLAAIRFLMIAELAWLWWALAAAQLLHAFSFAVHHSASILTIQRWFPGQAAARGQALYISVSYGIGGTSGSLLAATLWSTLGPFWTFASSSVAALLGAWAVRQAQRHDREDGVPHEVDLSGRGGKAP